MVPKLLERRGQPFVMISSGVDPRLVRLTVGHELFHALFFTNAKFRRHVFNFWENSVSAADRRAFLAGMLWAYPTMKKDRFLVVNEFLAYVLQPDAVQSLRDHRSEEFRSIAWIPEKYIPLLRASLRDAGFVSELDPKL